MADLSSSPIPDVPRPLVLADIAVQARDSFPKTDHPAALARLAMNQPWTVRFGDGDHLAVIPIPDQHVTEADVPMLTALLEELAASNPTPPYDLDKLVDGAGQRMASVNAGKLAEGE